MSLSEDFYNQIVKQIIETAFPNLHYTAGLIGSGSEVLGFDTERSTDHHWGPRVMIFIDEKDITLTEKIGKVLSEKLPSTFNGYSTHFGNPDEIGVQLMTPIKEGELINHRIEIHTVNQYFNDYMKLDIDKDLSLLDWLTISEQKLNTIRKGRFFNDLLNLKDIQKKLYYYPDQVWYYLLASEWKKISQQEAFVGRCGEVEDELGSGLVTAQIIKSLMRLCFYMEKDYIPYDKWFGTAFKNLNCAKKLLPILVETMKTTNWKSREEALSKAYKVVAQIHNELNITKYLSEEVSNYYDRPYKVIHADRFVESLKEKITDVDLLNIKSDIGCVNQFSENVDLLNNDELLKKLKVLYT